MSERITFGPVRASTMDGPKISILVGVVGYSHGLPHTKS